MIRRSVGGRGRFVMVGILPHAALSDRVIPGDEIGEEVISTGLEVLKAVAERHGGIEWSFR